MYVFRCNTYILPGGEAKPCNIYVLRGNSWRRRVTEICCVGAEQRSRVTYLCLVSKNAKVM